MLRMGVGVGVLAITSTAGLALGQYALGDGRALDANTQVGSQGINNQVRDYRSEFRFRNALVTGNVPGGYGFRDEVGYGLPGDFRQRIGTDDLFEFRRDSFTSGLAGVGIRGIEALQYQMALTVGNQPPAPFRGSLVASRSLPTVAMDLPGQGAAGDGAGASLGAGVGLLGEVDLRPADGSAMGTGLPALRSSASYLAGLGLEPTLLHEAQAQDGQVLGLVASPLRGLARQPLSPGTATDAAEGDAAGADAAGAPWAADGLDDRAQGLGATGDDAQQAGDDGRVRLGRLPGGRLGPADVSESMLRRLAEDYARRLGQGLADPSGRSRGGAQPLERPDALRPDAGQPDAGAAGPEPAEEPAAAGLGGVSSGALDAGGAGGDVFSRRLAELQRALRRGTLSPQGQAGGEGAPADGTPAGLAGSVEGFDALVKTLKTAAGTVQLPAGRLDRPSAYELHLDRARAMLREGRYFEAEQRFTMALAARPGDAIAQIGRVHAQLGAGLDLSAAVNLRQFLTEHPQFVGASYGSELLPSADRLQAAAGRLRQRLDEADGRASLRERALLLAYVGRLRGDAVLVRLGLERLGEGPAGRADPLVELLRAVWLDEPIAPADGQAQEPPRTPVQEGDGDDGDDGRAGDGAGPGQDR
ncbi:MAG: hypothetical protein KatS3mg103_1205 [Phycisphaerales bacterium]|nr:MAG: hypothetical protein KatS3mg103_1205 [Phycisphaerales bacterium]